MENKSNSLNRIKRHQREKVLRFSIRKYSFGAASVAVAALMFLGARVASADSVIENHSQPTTDVVNQKEKDKPLVEIQQPTDNKVEVAQNPSEKELVTNIESVVKVVDKAKLKKVVEELKTTLSSKSDLDKSVISPIKDRVQKGQALLDSDTATQKDVNELLSLLESDLTALSNATKESSKVQETATENKTEIKDNKTASELSEADKTISDKKESLKLSAEQLQAAVLELPEHESTKEVFEKANELLGLAQGVIENTTISPNDVEDMTKRVKRMFNSVKNATTRLNSGARDSRNGQRMAQGTQFRAYTATSSSGALKNVRYFASVDSRSNGGSNTKNDDPEFTEKKTVIKAKYEQNSSGKWMVYDVYFNNNGVAMADKSYSQHYYFQPPFNIMDGSNKVENLTFTRYRNLDGNSNRKLSDGGSGFQKVGETVTISNPWAQKTNNFPGDRRSTYDPQGVSRANQKWQVFKHNQDDPYLDKIVKRTDGSYTGGVSYTLGMEVGASNLDYAIHMTARVKLKDNVTETEAANGNVYAASVTTGLTTSQSYIVGSQGTSLKTKPDAQLYPIQGSTHTKTVGDSIPNSGNPVADRYITRKGNGEFPGGMSWSWEGNNSPSTVNAGKFTYTAIARYQDGTTSKDANSGSDGRVYFTVNPKKPTITTSVVNKKGLTNQTIEVNVGSGVKNGSVVKLYDGNRVIGQGTSNGTTARITVSGALPGNPLKAETTVDNGGVVVSEKSDPVTPTEAPDTQAPTLTITPANQTVVEGQTVTFTVTARDNKHVNLDANDFLTKYGTRVFSGKASITSPTDTDTEKTRRITITTTAEDVGKTNTITFNATDNANHRATPVTFTLTVTSRDKIAPTITAGNATVTSREQITPISVTAVDNTGGVGMRDNNPIEVTGLPTGLTYANNRITGTPTGAPGNSTVTIKAYDKNGNMATKTITITVRSQADAHNPTGTGLTVNQNHTITDAELKAKVSNVGPGTLSIVSRPSTATAGNAGNAVVKVTYPDGTSDNVNVPVTVTDVTGPTITAESATVTKNESITPIPVTAVDNTGGVGMRDNNPIEVTNLPAGLRYANNQITGTPTAGVGYYTVTIKAYDKNNRSTTKQIRITVRSQAEAHNPTGETLTVPYNHNITDDEVKAKVQNFAPGTLTVQSKPSTNTSGNVGNAVVKVTYPDGSHDTVNVPVVVGRPNKDDYTPKYNDGSGKPGESVKIPVGEANGKTIPSGTTYTSGTPGLITVDDKGKVTVTIPSDKNPGDKVTGKVLVRYPDGSEEEVPVTVTVVNRDKDDYTPKYNDGSGKPGASVDIPVSEANGKTIPAGTTYTSKTPGVVTVDDKGKVTVTIPSDKNPGDKVTGKVLVRYPDGSEEEVPVKVTVVNRDKDDYTPKYNDGNGKPGASVGIPVSEANGKTIPAGTTYTSLTPGVVTVDDKGKVTVTIPADKNPGDEVTGKVLVRYPDGSEEEVPVKVTVVNRDKDDYTPKYNDGSGKPGESVKIPVGEANGKTIPSGTTYTSGTPGVITVDDKGKVTVTIPSDKNPGDEVTGKVLVRYPDGSEEEVPVKVTVVNRDKDDYTPKYNDGNGKPGASVDIPVSEANGKTIPAGTTYTSKTPGVVTVDDKGKVTVTIPSDKNPGDKVTGKVLVRYPDGSEEEVPVTVTVVNRDKDDYTPKYNDGSGKPGASVDIPVSEANGKTIPAGTTYTSKTPGVVTVDDKGKVTVTIPSDKNPGDKVTGKVLVRYPDGSEEEVPVKVTVVNRDKDDYTPKYNDGNGKPGASVGIPVSEANGKTIPAGTTYTSLTPGVVTVDDKGKVTVTIPADKNPGDEVTGKVLVRYPDGSEEEVPVKVTVVNRDKDDYTPKYNDGSGKPGESVKIPVGEANGKTIPSGTTYTSGTPGVITVDDKGKVTVTIPSDKNPGDEVTGKVLVRYPDGSEEEVPVKVTVVNRDKDDYTPKYNDGNGKPGASVDIPVSEANGKTIPAGTTYTSKTPGVVTVDDKGKVTVTIPSDKNPGDKVTGKVLVRYPDGSEEEVPVTVTVVNRDKDDYTPKYNDGSGKPGASVDIPVSEANGKTIPAGTTYTSKTPGVVTVDDKGKVTVTIPSDKNPGDKVTGKVLVRYPDGSEEEVPVKVTVVNRDKDDYTPKYNDGNGKPGASVGIPVSEANGKTIPAGTTYTSLTPGVVTVDDKGKVTVTIPADKNPGDEVTGKVLVRYPDGSEEEVPVKVTVVNRDKDDYTPKYNDGSGKPGESVKIPVGEANGKTIPSGTTYTSGTPGVITVDDKGKVTVTIPSDKNPGDEVTGKVLVRYPDGSEEEVPVKVTVVNRDKDDYTPKYNDGNGKPGASVDIPVSEANGKTIPAGTTYTSKTPGVVTVDDKGKVTVTIPSDKNPGDKVTGKVLVRYPDGSEEEVPVTVTVVNRDKDDYTPKYDDGNGKPGESVEIPVGEANGKTIPSGTTYTSGTPGLITVDDKGKVTVTIPSDKNPGDKVTGKVLVRYPDGSEEEVPVTVTVVNRDKDDYTPKYDDGNGKPGESVEIPVGEANGKTIPSGTTYTSGTPGLITVDDKGKVTVTIPADKNPGDEVTGKVLVRYPDGSEEEVPVKVTVVNRDKDDYTPKYNDGNGKPGESVEIPVGEANGKTIPSGTTYTSGTPGLITVDDKGKVTVTIPSDKNPGDKVTGKVLVRYPDGSEEEVPVKVTVVNRDKDDYTPKYNDGSGKPGESVKIPVGEANGKTIPSGTTYTSGTPGVITVDDKGKVTVTIPADKNPGDEVTGKVLVRYPDGSEEEVPVKVTVVNRDKDDYTPKYNDGNGKPGESVEIPVGEANGKTIPSGTTYTSGTPGLITVDDKGKVTVTIPSDKNPGDEVTGKVLVRYPDGSEEEVPVTVTVTPPEKLTPTVDVEQDPKTGDVTVTPKRPDGSTYPPGTTVEIPGKDGNPITVTIGEDGKGKVPNSELPEGKVPGTAKITEPGKPAVEVPNVTTPAHKTPTVDVEQDPKTGDVTVTPKRPDGSTYPPGTTVEIPGKDGNPITVTIGEDGKGKVPNSELPEGKVPGTGKITEPGKPVVEVPNVTTPAHKTPTVDVEQDPKTGDVTVTPKRPDGSTYPPGTTVEIPGKDGNPITVTIGEDGKGKVPNSELPEGKVPGTAKITEPGKPAVEVPNVTTPAHKTPTVDVEQDPKTGDVTVTPKRPDGSTYPPGTTVEIPGKDGNPITVTIGEDGKGKVPNSELPEGKVPGTAKITEPGKPAVEVPNVTTPAHKTPTVDVEQDPKTGDVTVTPKRPDGSTYPPGTTVEIPGKDGNPITVTIGEDGKGKVPNSELPEGKVPGTGKITEPGKPAVEVPNVTTPAHKTPTVDVEQDPKTGDVTVTPKRPDGSTYPPGTTVEIPGKDGNPITVTIGEDGKGKVPNSELPEGKVPGTGKITEPGKPAVEVPNVTTPAHKTPTVDVEQDPKTGDVTVTPKRPDGSTYPPGTTVEIPGKDGNPITVTIGEDGKGKVPNSELPEGKVPGTAKITEPGKPAVEVPVETPAKVTPATPTDTIPVAPVTPDTPVKPDTNGGSGQDTPAPAIPTPNAVTPNADQVDTKTTNDNGAKSNDSQNVLPNTGTESNAALASLGLLGLLSGFGLVARKKKED